MIAPIIISGVAPIRNCKKVIKKAFCPLPYFLIKTEARAFKLVAIKTNPSPVILKLKPPASLKFIISIPIEPIIRAAIFLAVSSSSPIKITENITIRKALEA